MQSVTADKLLALARGELGVTERPAGSNKVKYNTAYYGREVSGAGYPWCCTFVWWLFQQAGASALFYGGGRTAYCPTLLTYHKKQGVRGDYRPGDVIFFNFSGKTSAAHVGICEGWDGEHITTIDGNTGSGNEANGGAVMRRTRHKKYIVGAYRPAYEEEETVTQTAVVTVTSGTTANLRLKPTTRSRRIAKVPAGTTVTLVEQADGWAKIITPEGERGYMMTQFLKTANETIEARLSRLEERVLKLERGE